MVLLKVLNRERSVGGPEISSKGLHYSDIRSQILLIEKV